MVATRDGSLLCTLVLVIANLFIPLSIVVFATGFFPHKPFLPGLADHEALGQGPAPGAPFDRLIFMVVDALRSDFVYSDGSGFKYTQSLIRDGAAIPFTANARSPTVTMPRIKAITTGSIPSFVDLILNINEADTSSTLATQDTWLAQLKAAGKGKLLMYGDDTWLKLFPDTFDRHDGTTSFFVSDFTEVDHNVTRNIAAELERSDWGLMVLHYLGLDHIGHKAGPRSSNMLPKQREMDDVVETIYKAMESKHHLQSTLLVLCGDHGMNDAGNHGASSPGETSPALVFLSPKLRDISQKLPAPTRPGDEFDYYTTVEQSDIAPTIATLLGFPISKNNLGAFIPEFLPFWPSSNDKVQILVRNAQQILDIVTATFGKELFDIHNTINPCALEATSVHELACEWRKIGKQAASLSPAAEVDHVWLTETSAWLRKAQDLMSSMASNYDMSRIFIGQGLAIAAAIGSGAVAMLQGACKAAHFAPLLLITMSYGIMMFASSYVEEEQHFWYWSSTLWIAWLGSRAISRTARLSSAIGHLLSLGALRLARGWNQTGQKFAGEPDIVKMFLAPNPRLVWALVSLTYISVLIQMLLDLRGIPVIVALSLTFTLVSAGFIFKLAFTAEDAPELVAGLAKKLNDALEGPSLTSRARIVFLLMTVLAAVAVYQRNRGGRHVMPSVRLLRHLYTLLAMTQSRATNIPLLLLASAMCYSLGRDELSVPEITASAILLQNTFFFAFGGSNAISSVDLSSAYNGVNDFNIMYVGVLTFIGNWAGPIFWTLATNSLLLRKCRKGQAHVFRHHLTLLTLFTTASAAFVMAACTALRTHLFIWTVFSPKYLYCMAWSLGQHLAVNVGLGGLLFQLGAR
ncbi:type I phosphodiesterase / nucleotide pyrophosphatase [Hirsutella rhossiliensis]|uniref:GPI ethanolamine phosphate transferase 2 n=1 Tax=Hirsutella rhossiliensis TaxID=111463 RepID=A0A9P8MPS7_9HYPO|nr:type I phosphodiesterase / nucleotide pyrophosphatase domain-containing protein [Hirsutella rhossiliensis]KAH0960043.1 type I phosphodiesterase / nucleotide pyrophosphatase domain-containing protein [Hirsutella rhossiliensis]